MSVSGHAADKILAETPPRMQNNNRKKNKTTLLNKMVKTEPGRWLTGRESRALVSTPARGMHEYCCNLTSNTTTNPSQ